MKKTLRAKRALNIGTGQRATAKRRSPTLGDAEACAKAEMKFKPTADGVLSVPTSNCSLDAFTLSEVE